MRRLILTLLLLPVPVLADVVASAPKDCTVHTGTVPAAAAGTDGFRRLDRLPPASEYLTVFRRVGHCPAPVIVGYRIGSAPRQ